jgi:NADH dehydrogenase
LDSSRIACSRTPGVRAHALRLETKADAQRFHARMVNACIRAHAQVAPLRPEQLHVAIIGAGATGVELAAELHRTTREVIAYGLDRVDAEKDIQVSVIEAADRVLPALPPRMSTATETLLRELGVDVHANAKVAEVVANGVLLADGRMLPAELVVWAAGVKAPVQMEAIRTPPAWAARRASSSSRGGSPCRSAQAGTMTVSARSSSSSPRPLSRARPSAVR